MVDEATVNDYLRKPYNRVFNRESDGRYSAYVLEWPGCYGDGDNAAEANHSLEASMAAWVEVMLEDRKPIPEPLAREYSGRVALRLPKSLHQRVAARAQAEGTSINQLIVNAVESHVTATDVTMLLRGVYGRAAVGGGIGSAIGHAVLDPSASIPTIIGMERMDSDAATPGESIITDEEGRWGIRSGRTPSAIAVLLGPAPTPVTRRGSSSTGGKRG